MREETGNAEDSEKKKEKRTGVSEREGI
jgi:hypothetical protein